MRKIRVLHIDDNQDFTDTTAEFLERENENIETITETNPDKVLEKIKQNDIDCILSDYEMPEMDGIELLRKLRKDYPDLPFILFTGKGSEKIASRAISAGVTDYIKKESFSDQHVLLANKIKNVVSARRSERRVQKRNHQIEQILKTVPSCIVQLNHKGEFVFANERAKKILGLEKDEVTDRTYNDPEWKITDLDGNPIPDEKLPFRQVRDSGEPIYNFKHTVEWPSGEKRILSVNGAPLFDSQGNVESTVFSLTDITDRLEREKKRQQTINRVTDAIVKVNKDWQFVFVDSQAEKLYDMKEKDLLGKNFWDVFPESLNTTFEREYRKVMEKREPTEFEEYYPSLDKWFYIQVYPDDDGGISFYFREITEKKEREKELIRNQLRFEAVFNSQDTFIGLVSPDGILQKANDAALEFIDADPSEVEGKLFWETPWWNHSEKLQENLKEWIEKSASGEDVQFESYHYSPDGEEIFVDGSVRPVMDKDGNIISTVVEGRDITERKKREKQLQRQNKHLEDFASLISHELRNPLNIAQINLDFLENGESIKKVQNSLNRMEEIIDRLLTYTKTGKTIEKKHTVKLNSVSKRSFQNVIIEDCELEIKDEMEISTDPELLRHLLENLFKNAVENGASKVWIGKLENGFYIADDGSGIPEEKREKIFNVGYSDKGDTGLGLALVEQIIASHDWDISVKESKEEGAKFEIYTD